MTRAAALLVFGEARTSPAWRGYTTSADSAPLTTANQTPSLRASIAAIAAMRAARIFAHGCPIDAEQSSMRTSTISGEPASRPRASAPTQTMASIRV